MIEDVGRLLDLILVMADDLAISISLFLKDLWEIGLKIL